MTPDDLAFVLGIQQACYPPSMNEAATTILERLAEAPEYAWIAMLRGEPAAYLMTYPSELGKITPLGGEFRIPDAPDCLYIHDLAVRPSANGKGLGAALVRHALAASRWGASALVCVQDAREFWTRQGFSEVRMAEPGQIANLSTYPGQPCYMVRFSAAHAVPLMAAE